jgi:uncharacterized protein
LSTPISDLDTLIASMQPALNDGVYVFVLLPANFDVRTIDATRLIATFREAEGVTAIMREDEAIRLKLDVQFRAAWITLTVHSALSAVGLTAAFAAALGRANISCNVWAALHHDHIFVPIAQAADAMSALKALQAGASRASISVVRKEK